MCQRILINVYVHARCVCVLFVFFIEMAHKMIAYVYNEKRGVRGNGGKLYIYYNHGRGIKLSPCYNFEHDRTCTRTHTRTRARFNSLRVEEVSLIFQSACDGSWRVNRGDNRVLVEH